MRHSVTLNGMMDGTYCSKPCRNKGKSGSHQNDAIILLIMTFILIILLFIIQNGTFGWFIFAFSIVSIPSIYTYYWAWRNSKIIVEPYSKKSVGSSRTEDITRSGDNTTNDVHIPVIHVKQLDMDVLSCCYQSARFGKDDYCVCGRVVSIELKQIFSKWNILPYSWEMEPIKRSSTRRNLN